jgi:hypothetical protein
MDIDQNSIEPDAATGLGETAQPIQRAKRTYGTKSKTLVPPIDDKDSSDRPSLSAGVQSTTDSLYGSSSMSTAGFRSYDWAERLKEIDRSDDEIIQEDAGATGQYFFVASALDRRCRRRHDSLARAHS